MGCNCGAHAFRWLSCGLAVGFGCRGGRYHLAVSSHLGRYMGGRNLQSGFMIILRWVACLIFVFMGISLIRNADREIHQNSRLTKPGVSAGFFAGLAVILSNPKAILFYLGILPGFFDLAEVSTLDIFAIITISALIPFLGNCVLSLMVTQTQHLLKSPQGLRRTHILSGFLLIIVGIIIPLT